MVKQLTLSIALVTLLSSCSQLNPLSFLSGGTNVAANTQIGKENSQNVGVNTTFRPVIRPEGDVEEVNQDNSTTKITEVDPLLLLLLVLGWLAPSPNEIGRGFIRLFKRK